VKIVFWGTPSYAAENLLSILKAGHKVTSVVTQPDRKRGRGNKLSPSPVKQVAIDFGIPVHTTEAISKDKNTTKILFNLKADVYIVVAFGQILPKEILDQPKFGCWNSHASLLPKWRGAAPIQWSIINNDLKTGVCIMAMEEGLDTGPVIEQEATVIKDNDNLEILTNRLSKISSKLLLKTLEKIKLTQGLSNNERLTKLNAIDQFKLLGTPSYARQINKDDYLIDWDKKAIQIFKLIQGVYPKAFTYFNKKRIKILQVIIVNNSDKSKSNISIENKSGNSKKPGEITMIDKRNGILVNTNDYPILIKFGQLEGKNKTDAFTLSIQANLRLQDRLGN
tara:strand:- start:107 stop:1117 length:1011 start_codon:yes stop_codon:yes gene_type:complete